jgi:hypothetical protein
VVVGLVLGLVLRRTIPVVAWTEPEGTEVATPGADEVGAGSTVTGPVVPARNDGPDGVGALAAICSWRAA